MYHGVKRLNFDEKLNAMSINKEIKDKILDKANEICNERYGTSLYEACGLHDNDAGCIREFLTTGILGMVKCFGVGAFMTNLASFSCMLPAASSGNKDRALRRLYDNKVVKILVDRMETYMECSTETDDDQAISAIAAQIAEDAMELSECRI